MAPLSSEALSNKAYFQELNTKWIRSAENTCEGSQRPSEGTARCNAGYVKCVSSSTWRYYSIWSALIVCHANISHYNAEEREPHTMRAFGRSLTEHLGKVYNYLVTHGQVTSVNIHLIGEASEPLRQTPDPHTTPSQVALPTFRSGWWRPVICFSSVSTLSLLFTLYPLPECSYLLCSRALSHCI